MRALEMKEMKMIMGGNECGGALVGAAWAGLGVLAAEVALASMFGPVGWVAAAGIAIAYGSAAAASTQVVFSC